MNQLLQLVLQEVMEQEKSLRKKLEALASSGTMNVTPILEAPEQCLLITPSGK